MSNDLLGLILEDREPAWTFEGNYGALTAPLVVAGDRLIGVANSTVFAVDIHTGAPAPTARQDQSDWLYTLQSFYGGDPQVTAADGAVFMMDDEALLALRLSDGLPLPGWEIPSLSQVSRLFAKGKRVIAVHHDAEGATMVSAYIAATGAKSFGPVKITKSSAGPVAYGDGAVFFVADSALQAVNVDFGDRRWTASVPNDTLDNAALPLVAGSRVVVAGQQLHAVDLIEGKAQWTLAPFASGNVRWHTPVADVPAQAEAATLAANMHAPRLLRGDLEGRARLRGELIGLAYGGAAVVTNTGGDVICVGLQTGNVLWHHTVPSPGAPVIIDGVVFVTTNDASRLIRFDLATGNPLSNYALSGLSRSQPATIANGSLFLADDLGRIVARPFAAQQAAYFDGTSSHIQIEPRAAQFDFGKEDFTVEAWFRSSTGGEIISSYPTVNGPDSHGFRLNLTPDGRIRVAVIDATVRTSLAAARTNASGAADGEWHHVALVRTNGTFIILLDGISQTVRLPGETIDARLSIGGQSALTIGAFIPYKDAAPISHFRGLIREVRIWDRALDASTIQTNRQKVLHGTEPRLKGLWRLDENHSSPKPVQNAVVRHRVEARFLPVATSAVTDLVMDDSSFPYLLHETAPQWPYAGTWAARGARSVTGSPSLSSDQVVAFSTSDAIYAVGAHDGKRVWSMRVAGRASDPVGDGRAFLVLTESELLRIESKSGVRMMVPEFGDLDHDAGTALVAPAVNLMHVAVATAKANGVVHLWDRTASPATHIPLHGTPVQLVFGGSGSGSPLGVLTRTGAQHSLSIIDCLSATLRGTRAIAGPAFCMASDFAFCVDAGSVLKLDVGSINGVPLARSTVIAGNITGIAASVDEDVIIVATDAGIVYGLTLGNLSKDWERTLPVKRTNATNAVNRPVMGEGGRVLCTTAGGTVVVLDASTGIVQGLYSTAMAAMGTPLLVAGTVFTGCADTPANEVTVDIDGALHSIVMGETTALRLNLDERGACVRDGMQHAVVDIDDDDETTLQLLRVHESCVEAWVNVPVLTGDCAQRAGGGIVGILPTENSGFDVNMWLDPGGTLHYTSRASDGVRWMGLHAKASTKIVDGKWHHIAVTRRPPAQPALLGAPDRLIMYIDGKAVAPSFEEHLPVPAKLHTNLKAYVGATSNDDLAASRPFCGLIAEVRVWDTYMESTEISARMNVKLRGDEPDLIAYWNFDYAAVHDSAQQGHDGMLALPVTHPVWWLTDLPFTQPSYPHITSTASIKSEDGAKTTTYDLVLKVIAADGAGLPKQDVHMWYVKHAPDDPASIFLDGTEVQAVDSSDQPHPLLRSGDLVKSFKATTGQDGTLKLTVRTPNAGHGPALDMWSSFMPQNQRFHVSVLLDNQTLAKPAPPTLSAQATLIQDYHYTEGNKVDDTRDRSTWRVVLRSANSNDDKRPLEPVTLWSSEPLTILVQNNTYKINAQNDVTLDSEPNGEMTIVFPAEGLTAPVLYARAGFMHRNDRMVVTADQDSHAKLSSMKSEDYTKQRVTNWKKDSKDEGDTLLSKDQAPHARRVSQAVHQVTSSVKPVNPEAPPRSTYRSPARRKLIMMRPMTQATRTRLLAAGDNAPWNAPRLSFMRQPATVVPTDRVIAMRALAGTPRPAPVNPDAFRESLHGNLGFVFEKVGPRGMTYMELKTPDEVTAARETPTPPKPEPDMLTGFFDSMWNGIKDAAEAVYDAATKIVVTVANQVELAITTMVDGVKNIVHKVVASVEDALNAVAGFFEQLAVGIMKVIAFLRAIFNWKQIIASKDVLKEMFMLSTKMATKSLRDTGPFLRSVRSLAGVPIPETMRDTGSMNGTATREGGKDSAVRASADSVEGKSMTQKSATSPVRSASDTGDGGTPVSGGSASSGIMSILEGATGMVNSMLDMSFGDLGTQLLKLVGSSALVAAADAMALLSSQLAKAVDFAIELLNTKIQIPFISELYKWITGSDLTVLDVVCLALGVAVNVVYAVVQLIQGKQEPFAAGAGPLLNALRAEAGEPVQVLAPEHALMAEGNPLGTNLPGTNQFYEFCFLFCRIVTIMWDANADFLRSGMLDNTPQAARQFVAYGTFLQGLAGGLATTLQRFVSYPMFRARIEAVAGNKADHIIPPLNDEAYVVYSLQMAPRMLKLFTGLWGMFNEPKRGCLDSVKDVLEFPLTALASGCGIYFLITSIGAYPDRKAEIQALGNSDVAKQYELFAIRDMLGLVNLSFDWMFTDKGAGFVKKLPGGSDGMIHTWTASVRALSSLSGFALHAVAIGGYGSSQ